MTVDAVAHRIERPIERLRALLPDFWSVILFVSLVAIGLLLIWPIAQVLTLGFRHPET